MKLNILLVEDNAMNLELHRDLLEVEGHAVTVCESAAEFREQIASGFIPDVVLMDLLLPDASGTELLAELKQSSRLAHVAVLAITAHALPGDIPKLVDAGFAAVLTKPIDTRTFTLQILRFSGRQ